jgi:DNA-binding XRE family transcriptional regulator
MYIKGGDEGLSPSLTQKSSTEVIMEKYISCGIPYIDNLTGGILLGDNVVWILEPGMYFDYFLESFFTAPDSPRCKNIYVSFDFPPQKIFARYEEFMHAHDFILVDAFTYGKGKGDALFKSFYKKDSTKSKSFRSICIKNMADPEEFIQAMSELQGEFRESDLCKYVFYSLTGMQELWGERDTLHFFTYTCPKLYELKALAYWPLVKEAHTKAFLASISYITQLVVSLSFGKNNACVAKFLKMDGRPSHLLNINHSYNFHNNKLNFLETPSRQVVSKGPRGRRSAGGKETDAAQAHDGSAKISTVPIGERIRQFRLEKNISQVALARILGVTPSALSQIESNQSYPSLHLFVEIGRCLGKSLDEFFVERQSGSQIKRPTNTKHRHK